jgi:hypothetical protein
MSRADMIVLGTLTAVFMLVASYHTGFRSGLESGLVSCERGAVSKITEGRMVICQYSPTSSYGQRLLKERVR